jgi:TolR protein
VAGATLDPAPGGGDGYRPLAEINVTPLVDVMLVLLVIFMVAAPLMTVGVPVRLPKTSAAPTQQPRQPIVVSMTGDGRLFLREEPLTPAQLIPRLQALRNDDAEATVYVRGDRDLAYGRIMEVIGLVNQSGFAGVSLIAEAGAAPAAIEAQ